MKKTASGAAGSRQARPDQARGKSAEEAKKKRQQGPAKKMSEYGKQLYEKQRVKRMYGMREKQFRKFFKKGVRMQEGAPGDNLLSLLERRLDNVLYRLKMAVSRRQARQVVVHGHVFVNGRRVHTPSYLVRVDDAISLSPRTISCKKFLEQVVDKRLKIGIKVPEWLELEKDKRQGRVLRYPVRNDIQVPIEELLIVELYSK